MKTLAFDKSVSFRWHDADGRLHVDKSNLTRVQVAPYYGREIPDYEKLGLDPEKIYQGYRPAEELGDAETIKSVIGIPIQLNHHLDYPDDPATDTRVGSTGDQAEFDGTYLSNSLHIQNEDAIRRIKDGSMSELSLAYSYDPDFKSSGEYEGQKYDFTMRNIRGQHLALVEKGRAGKSCCVEDHALEGVKAMDEKNLPEKANDASPDVEKAEVKIADAIGQLADLLRNLHHETPTGEVKDITEDEDETGAKIDAIAAEIAELGVDEGTVEKIKAALHELAVKPENAPEDKPAEDEEDAPADEDKPEDEDKESGFSQLALDALKACGLDDAPDDVKKAFVAGLDFDKKDDEDGAEDEEVVDPENDGEDDDESATVAQDAAIKRIEAKINAKMDAIEECKGVLGRVKLTAFDSAGSVYVAALKQIGVSMQGITPANARAAYRGYQAGQKLAKKSTVAADAAIKDQGFDIMKGLNVRVG